VKTISPAHDNIFFAHFKENSQECVDSGFRSHKPRFSPLARRPMGSRSRAKSHEQALQCFWFAIVTINSLSPHFGQTGFVSSGMSSPIELPDHAARQSRIDLGGAIG
jgi:hypothetical protein